MFVKFDCGCVGIVREANQCPVIVDHCDRDVNDDGSLGFSKRDMRTKSYSPVSTEAENKLIREIGSAMADGYALRQVQNILGRGQHGST